MNKTQPANSSPPPAAGPSLDKGYKPADHEPGIRAKWESAKIGHADPQNVLTKGRKPFCILIPPPNVTGALHLGHALNNTLQDTLSRYHRMRGDETLWMPGTDHAGIATQAVVERRLRKEGKLKGPLKDAMTRDQFVAQVQTWKDEYEATITEQLKAMGCSCDWDRQRFTMDEVCARAVREAFFRLFRDGLIYRGKRLVNWDPALQTAVADDECYEQELDTSFWYLRYPLVHASGADPAIRTGGSSVGPMPITWSELARRGYPGADEHPADQQAWVTVATTRPETYLGDTAVAISSHDPRAKALDGMFAELPLVGRPIPIVVDTTGYVVLPKAIAEQLGRDEEAKDPKAEFATGFLKVTPAHDQNDYEIGQRHKLPMINVMAPDGTISDKHGWTDIGDASIFLGKKREDARKLVIKEFESRGLLENTRPYRHSVKHSDRSKAIIEPYLSDQWYVRVTDERMAKSANAAVSNDSITFHPDRYAKTYQQWHDGIRDWCISRQLWWGHQIPVWHFNGAHHSTTWDKLDALKRADRISIQTKDLGSGTAERTSHEFFVSVRSADDHDAIQFLEHAGAARDPDVLDTWFSSALWPLSTLGWPDPALNEREGRGQFSGLLQAFNPTSVLSTAREIITLWVSRMVMMNRYLLPEGFPKNSDLAASGKGNGPIPFHDVFIHAVVQDGSGQRMSKSAGNGVDPLDIIASHGADALRFTLCQMTTHTQDVRLPVAKDPASGRNTSPRFDAGRNFCNKIWNAARFTMSMLQREQSPDAPDGRTLSLADRWMLSRLARAVAAAEKALDSYEFAVYSQSLYDLLWGDFCDWYLEAIKPTIASRPAQREVLRTTLDVIVRLLHPVVPFVTEAVFDQIRALPGAAVKGINLESAALLARSSWPKLDASLIDERAEQAFERARSLVTAIREARAKHNVPPKQRVILHAPQGLLSELGETRTLVETLAGLESATSSAAPSGPSLAVPFGAMELQLSNLAVAATDGATERERLAELIAEREKELAAFDARLNNPGYVDRAPTHLVEQTRQQRAAKAAEREAAKAALERLG